MLQNEAISFTNFEDMIQLSCAGARFMSHLLNKTADTCILSYSNNVLTKSKAVS